jgi:putative FmdB family regulatory protein
MPIYEYQCQNCGHKFEEIQGINDEPLKKCPECGKPKLEKLISAPAFHLKGTGWYVTDFKDKNKKSEMKKTETHSTTDSTKETKASTTTDTTTTTKKTEGEK